MKIVNSLIFAIVAMTFFNASLSAQSVQNAVSLGGTINIVLANKNGAVVLTDSMLSDESGPVPIPHPELPGQKLFQLDDKTVCAIAGFVSVPGLFPEFSPSVSSVMKNFSAELAKNPPQQLSVKLTALAMLMSLNISAIGALRESANKPLQAKNYNSTLTLVGYDLDGVLKIGQVQLATDPQNITRGAIITFMHVDPVGEGFIPKLAGKWETAWNLLSDPGSKPADLLLARLKSSLALDDGASLTLQDLRSLAVSLSRYTAQNEPTVGGDDQIAQIADGQALIVEQKLFPAPQKTLVRFNLMDHAAFAAPKSGAEQRNPALALFKSNAVVMASGVSALYVHGQFINVSQSLDNQYYYLSRFDDCVISYKGGPFYFDDNNEVTNSYLFLGSDVDTKDPKVSRLISGHKWIQVVR